MSAGPQLTVRDRVFCPREDCSYEVIVSATATAGHLKHRCPWCREHGLDAVTLSKRPA